MNLFTREQCRIMLGIMVAVLGWFFCRYDVPISRTVPIPPAGAEEKQRLPFVMEIVGEVARPGVYSFPGEVSVAQVIRKAGGLKAGAFLSGDYALRVPVNGSLLSIGTESSSSRLTMMDPHMRFLYFVPFAVNRASAEELLLVPGIGEKTARAIVCYRDRHGPFPRLESLLEVPGIGRQNFKRMKDFLVL